MSNKKRHIESGNIFRNWTVIRQEENKNKKRFFLCKCTCGIEQIISLYVLTKSRLYTCDKCRIHHGKGKSNTWKIKHGGTMNIHKNRTSSEYISWRSMKARCLNPQHDNYHLYGGKGITIYEEWVNDFSKFLDYLGPKPTIKHTIDRIDLDGNYEPGNVRWATLIEQGMNRSNTRRITIDGETVFLRDYCDKHGLDYSRVVSTANYHNITFNDSIEYVRQVPPYAATYDCWINLEQNLSANPVDLHIQCECGHRNTDHAHGNETNIGKSCSKCDCQEYHYSARQIRRLKAMKAKIAKMQLDKSPEQSILSI